MAPVGSGGGAVDDFAGCGTYAAIAGLPNVEPLGGETLGAVDALGAAAAPGAMQPPARASRQGAAPVQPPLPAGILPFGGGGDVDLPTPTVN